VEAASVYSILSAWVYFTLGAAFVGTQDGVAWLRGEGHCAGCTLHARLGGRTAGRAPKLKYTRRHGVLFSLGGKAIAGPTRTCHGGAFHIGDDPRA
jgi:hypothetical protein